MNKNSEHLHPGASQAENPSNTHKSGESQEKGQRQRDGVGKKIRG